MNLDQRLIRLIRSNQSLFFLTLVLGIGGGLLTITQARFLSQIIARVFLAGYNSQGSYSPNTINQQLIILILIMILRAMLVLGSEVSAQRIAIDIKFQLRNRLFSHIQSLGPLHFRPGPANNTGELSNVLTEGIEALDAYFSQYLPQLLLAVIIPIAFLIFIFPLDVITGIVLLLTAPLVPIFTILIGDQAKERTKKQWGTLSRMSSYFLDVLQGLVTLKFLGLSRNPIAEIANVADQHRRATLDVLRIAFLSALVLEMVATLSTAIIAVEVGLRLLYNHLSFEQALFVLLLAPDFYLPLRLLGTRFHAGITGFTAAQRIFEILESDPHHNSPQAGTIAADIGIPLTPPGPEVSKPSNRSLQHSLIQATIRFENVSYTYPDGRSGLNNVSFEIKPGQKVALVGPSGAGKTTIINLLLGFIKPTQGNIYIGNTDLNDISSGRGDPPSGYRPSGQSQSSSSTDRVAPIHSNTSTSRKGDPSTQSQDPSGKSSLQNTILAGEDRVAPIHSNTSTPRRGDPPTQSQPTTGKSSLQNTTLSANDRVAPIHSNTSTPRRGDPPTQSKPPAGKSSLQNTTLSANDRVALPPESSDNWPNQIAWVPQNPYLFNDTIFANLLIARSAALPCEIINAARLAYAHDFVQAFPDGYNTVIGERGARLSAGQAQRIALARAFLKDAPFLILDEATANLDLEQDSLIQKAISDLMVNRTVLIIAHSLLTVNQADQILVVNNGQIIERGTHASLSEQKGFYYHLILKPNLPDSPSPTPDNRNPHVDDQLLSRLPSPVSGLSPRPQSPVTSHSSYSSFPLFRLLQLLSPFTKRIALSILLGIATIGSGIGLMATSAYIISLAALHPSIAVLQIAIVGVRFFGITRGVFRYLERLVTHDVTFRILARLRVQFYQALEPLVPARWLHYRSGDLLSRVISDISSLESFYVRSIAPSLVAFFIMVFTSIYLGSFAPVLAVRLIFVMVIAGVCLPVLIWVLSHSANNRLSVTRSAMNVAIVDGIQGMPDLFSFQAQFSQLKKVEWFGFSLAGIQKKQAWISGFQISSNLFLANFCAWIILLTAIPLVINGQIPGIYLATLVLTALASFEAITPLAQAAQNLRVNLLSAQRLFEIVDSPVQITDPSIPLPIPPVLNLEIKNLSFRYPATTGITIDDAQSGLDAVQVSDFPSTSTTSTSNSKISQQKDKRNRISSLLAARQQYNQPLILNDLTIDFPLGKHLALVGASGAGKSTLANLLFRFWDYHQGNILLSGQELRDYKQDDIRQSLSIVPQNPHLFNSSIRENLLMARPGAIESELETAAKIAHIHDFISALPQGYDTLIGENGYCLSGGERQRLAIARAVLKPSQLLILDEPTAHLDNLTELAVISSLIEWMKGRSLLLISHRMAGLTRMDEILVLREGQIVERGRHAELLQLGGIYCQMWNLHNQTIEQ